MPNDRRETMNDDKSECQHKWVWVDKYSDLAIPKILGTDCDFVDVNFFRCEICDEIKAEVD